MRTQRLIALLVTLAAACLTARAQSPRASQAPQRIIVTARGVHNLSPEDAGLALPVHLRAVVTYYDPYIDARHGAIFVHDASGGVFVSLPARPILPIKAGDLVDITGVTAPGDYAPVVNGVQVRPVGQSSLPANPPKTTLTQLLTGAFDCQWVEVEGRVRSAHLGPNNVVLGIAADRRSCSPRSPCASLGSTTMRWSIRSSASTATPPRSSTSAARWSACTCSSPRFTRSK